MSQLNPLTGSILQTPQVQRQQSTDRDRQARRTAEQTKNAALADDKLDHQVESSEELTPIQKEQKHERRFKRPKHLPGEGDDADGKGDGDDEPHLDLTA
jgi:hypothetical protein